MSTIIDGSFTSTGVQFDLALPSGYTEFRMVNITDAGSAAANTNVMRAAGYSLLPAGYAYRNLKTNGAATVAIESMITTAGFTFVDPSNPPVFAQTAVTGITAASPAVVASVAHGLVVGDTVRLTGLNGTMQSMSGLLFTVDAVVDADHFAITFDAAVTATNLVGTTPTTTGFAQKVIVNPFSPQNVVVGPTAVPFLVNSLALNLNTVPSLSQGASQYSPFQRPYQVGAKLRFYLPSSPNYNMPQTANFIWVQVASFVTQAGYATPNRVILTILPGNGVGKITTAAALAPLGYPAGAAGYTGSFPFVTDAAEVPSIFSEAEDNTGFYGITIGTGVQTTGKLYQWFARKGYSI